MPSIFLSHNHNDKSFVRRLATDLIAKGIRVWIDEAEIKIGDSLIRKISSGIYEMDFLGAVLSPNSVQSRWVQEELEQALHIQISEAYVKVLPILLRDCERPGFLLDKVYADFRDESNYQSALEQLIERITQRYDHLKQSFPEGKPFQERIGDVLVKEGFSGLMQLVKRGEYIDELPRFITNQTVQSNLRLMALKIYIESGLQNDKMFKQLLEDFDQGIRDFMITSIREHGFDIDEETLRKVILDPSSSNDVFLHAVKLARDLVISKKISSNILLEDKIVRDTYWLVTLCAISGIIRADEPDSAERLSHFSGETYHVARKRIREYFEHLHDQNKLTSTNREKALQLLQKFCQDGASSEQAQRKMKAVIEKLSGKGSDKGVVNVITLLFLAADPGDASRLRLGEELREIQEKLQLAKLREQFELHQQMSVRPVDISQALLDAQPRIVHFSGHGTATGALCFENQLGTTHPIQPDALAALFEQFANQVNCVVLNACYSEIQADAIAKYIDYVIGMNQAIGDKAAIAFAVGFYQALGAGRTIEEAYKLGCVQIRLQGIPEHLTPVLIKKGRAQP